MTNTPAEVLGSDYTDAGAQPSRICTTWELRQITEEAGRRNYNRVLRPQVVACLDPNMLHALRPLLIHRYARCVEVDAHMRCALHIEGSPDYVPIDVPMEALERLQTLEDAIENRDRTASGDNSPTTGQEGTRTPCP